MLRKVLSTAVLAAVVTAGVSMNASAIGRLADVTVIDRSTGETLPVHFFKGEYWVAGNPGAKYSIAVTNQAGQRVMAVMSVDGVNVLNGQTAGVDQSGYVFSPFQRYEVNGWRKSNFEVAAFEFVASPSSYAERTGRPANVGVIGVALFTERSYVAPSYRYRSENDNSGGWNSRKNAPSAQAPAPSSAGAAAPAPVADGELSKRFEANSASREKLGTGHGEREISQVSNTSFERAQSAPNETISIRYDSRENLVAMGVIARRHPHGRGAPNAFPESLGYVPDPPRFWR
jgi:hypothetical protein